LLNYYDPAARPVYNASHAVVINFSFALIQLCDLVHFNLYKKFCKKKKVNLNKGWKKSSINNQYLVRKGR